MSVSWHVSSGLPWPGDSNLWRPPPFEKTKTGLSKRGEDSNENKTYPISVRSNIVEDDSGEEETKEGDEGTPDEREIWQVTHVGEEELETTEGEEVYLLAQLLEMTDIHVLIIVS